MMGDLLRSFLGNVSSRMKHAKTIYGDLRGQSMVFEVIPNNCLQPNKGFRSYKWY